MPNLPNRVARGFGIALRSGAAPLLVGARLANRIRSPHLPGIPRLRGSWRVASKVALDEFFFATEVAAAPVIPRRERPRFFGELDRALTLFEQQGWLEKPRLYHESPPPLRRAVLERGGLSHLPYECLHFESGYEPHSGEPGRARWLGYTANRRARAWILRHRGEPRPWVVCVPGYRMGTPLVDLAAFRAGWLYRRLGLNVAIPVLPLHGPRRIGRRGGDGYFSGDFVDTLHAQSQALWDVRRVLSWVRSQDAPRIAVHGISLGAYTTALVASMESELDCVVAGVPAADFPRLVRSHVPGVVFRAAEYLGYSFERIERLLSVVSPFSFRPRVPRRRRYLYAGLADRLASPDQARDLWEHWERPRVAWYQGSHISFLWEAEVRRFLIDAFHEQRVLAPEPLPARAP